MLRLLIFIFPAIMDMIMGTTFFIASFRMAQAGYDGFTIGALSATWAIVYSCCNLFGGRFVTTRNCTAIMITSCLLMITAASGFILLSAIYFQFIFIALVGIGAAMFFQPFQLFMKAIEKMHPQGCLTRSTALYTFSWSFGLATGPFISAFVWRHWNWQACYMLNIISAVIVLIGIVVVKHHLGDISDNNEQVDIPTGINRYENFPDIAWLGWTAAGVGFLTLAMVRSVLPFKAEIIKLSEYNLGLILATASYAQAFTGLLLGFGHIWMYRITPAVIFSVVGISGLVLFFSSSSVPALLFASLLYGIYSGYFCFYLVFHSLVHPEKSSSYIAINEVIVGLTCIIGPLAGGLLADQVTPSFPFLAVCGPIIAVLIIQIIVKQKIGAKLTEHRANNG
jgi:MFS family permease